MTLEELEVEVATLRVRLQFHRDVVAWLLGSVASTTKAPDEALEGLISAIKKQARGKRARALAALIVAETAGSELHWISGAAARGLNGKPRARERRLSPANDAVPAVSAESA